MEDEVRVMSFHPDMQQTPENVAKVLDIAGWNYIEAAGAMKIDPAVILDGKTGALPMAPSVWRELLDVAGRRAFDEGCDDCE